MLGLAVLSNQAGTVTGSQANGPEPDVEVLVVDVLHDRVAERPQQDHAQTLGITLLVMAKEVLDPGPIEPVHFGGETEA
jgi:hypothetical protein